MPGVIDYIDHHDVPGKNIICAPPLLFVEEELFCSGKVLYNGQPLGLIVAKSFEEAEEAAGEVKITYEETDEEPMFTIQDVLKHKLQDKIINVATKDRKPLGTNAINIVNDC